MPQIIDFQKAKRRLVGELNRQNQAKSVGYTDPYSFDVDFGNRPEGETRTYDDYVEGSTKTMRGYWVIIRFPKYWDESLLGFTEKDRLYIAVRDDQHGRRGLKVEDHEMGHHKYGSNESLVRAMTGTSMDDPSDEFYVHRRVA